MGEIADGLINGDFDFHTGEYIGRGGGFPRTNEKYRKTGCNAKLGVTSWLERNGVTDRQQQMDLIRKYVVGSTPNDSKKSLCIIISGNFDAFKKWFINNQTTNP